MKNKGIIITILGLLLFATLVSAQSTGLGANLGNGVRQIIDVVEGALGPFFSVFLGGEGEFFFERILFLFIIFSLVYVVVSSDRVPIFKDAGKPIVWIVTIAVSLLSTRFLGDASVVQTIILPYSVVGVAISAFLPFVIYFFFVQSFDTSPTLRKVLWVAFMVVFIGLWSSRRTEIGDLSWIYFWIAILSFLFLLFDGTIRRTIQKAKYESRDFDRRMDLIARLERDLEKLERHRTHYPDETFKRMKRTLVKQIKDLRKH